MFAQFQLVVITSAPSVRNKNSGRRLTKKASLTAVFTCDRAHWGLLGLWWRAEITGNERVAKMTKRQVVIVIEVGCIAATWICTKSFWFLRPTDELLSFRSSE